MLYMLSQALSFDVVVIMTDSRSSNMSFLDSKMLKNPGDVSGEKEYIPRSKMFPCYGNKLLQLVSQSLFWMPHDWKWYNEKDDGGNNFFIFSPRWKGLWNAQG